MTQAPANVPRPRKSQEQTPMLLVADPEADLAGLANHGITVLHSRDGLDALLQIGTNNPEAVLVGADLGGIETLTLIKAIRANRDVPIILGAGPEDAELAIAGLQAGVTACVARPYRTQELLPILRAAVSSANLNCLRAGHIELDLKAYVLRVSGQATHLPLREFELLRYLMVNRDRVVTKEEIALNVWHSRDAPPHNTIAVHIKRLRAKLGDDDVNPAVILTLRGLGYRFTVPS